MSGVSLQNWEKCVTLGTEFSPEWLQLKSFYLWRGIATEKGANSWNLQ